MKTFHPLSFFLGLVSGFLVLFGAVGGWRLAQPTPQDGFAGNRATGLQRQGGGMGQNLPAMAEQLGMTEEDLKKELQGGKTLRDIAQEKGIALPFGNRPFSGSGAPLFSSGSSATPPGNE